MNKNKDKQEFDFGKILDVKTKEEEKREKKEKSRYNPNLSVDYWNEIIDDEEGWVYSKLPNGERGERLRKRLTSLGYSEQKEFAYWKPKLKNLAFCEAKRWKALQYLNKEYKKVSVVFDEVLKGLPFCAIRKSDEWPGYTWVEFPKHRGSEGVSWSYWREDERKGKGERPDLPLNQELADKWFYYEERSYEIRKRYSWFERVFQMSISQKYQDAYYKNRYYGFVTKTNLVINGRNYLVGFKDGDREFGIICNPENMVTIDVGHWTGGVFK